MRQLGLWTIFLGLVLSVELPSAVAQTGQSLWLSELDTARRIAAETNRLVLIHFWAEWCRPCRQMEAEVFSRPEVLSAIASSYVAVKLNFDQNPVLARQLNVESIPTDIIMTPQGEILQKFVGGASAQRYIERINQVAAAWQQRQALLARMGPLPSGLFGPSSAATNAPTNLPVSPPVAGSGAPWPTGDAQPPRAAYSAPANPPSAWLPQNSAGTNQYPPQGSGYAAGGFSPSAGAQMAATPQEAPRLPQGGVANYGAQGATPPTPNAAPWAGPDPSTLAPAPPGANPPYTSASDSLSRAQFQIPPGGTAQGTVTAGSGSLGTAPTPSPMPSGRMGSPTLTGPGAPGYTPTSPAQQPVAGDLGGGQVGPLSPSGGNQPSLSPVARRDGSDSPPALDIPPGNPPLGLEGYCPVSLTDKHRWVLGNRRWGVRHEGRTYLFAGPEEQQKFLANPDRYAPVLSGYDVVQLVEGMKLVEGRREHGAWFGGRVYLFADEDSFQRFSADPYRYINALPQAVARLTQQMQGGLAGGNGSGLPTASPSALAPRETPAPGAPGLTGSAPVGEMPGLAPGAAPGGAVMPPTGAVAPKAPENSTAFLPGAGSPPGISATVPNQPGPHIHVGLPDRIMNSLPSRVVGPTQPGYAPVASRPNSTPPYGFSGGPSQNGYPVRY